MSVASIEGDYDSDGFAMVRALLARETCAAFLHQLKSDVDRAGGMARLVRNSGLTSRDAAELYGFHYPPMLGLLWGSPRC